MVRRVFVVLPGLLAMLALAPVARAQSNDPSFRVVNNTPNVVNEIFASPVDSSAWGQDRLGTEVVRPGGNHIVRLPADGNCVYDIRIVYQGGNAEERRGLNTCNLTDLVLGTAAAVTPPRGQAQQQANPSFNLVNRSSRVIEQFFASPSSQQGWGPDRLGDDLVQPGASYAIRLPVGECSYDIRVVWQGGESQERRRVNTCLVNDYEVR